MIHRRNHVARHPTKHCIGPNSLFASTFTVIDQFVRHALVLLNIVHAQTFIVEQFGEIRKNEEEKNGNRSKVRNKRFEIELWHAEIFIG